MNLSIFIFAVLCGYTLAQGMGLSTYCGYGTTQPNKIVGGTPAKKGNWGWQIAMKYNGRFLCGGSLINNQWIITAAHCVAGRLNPTAYLIDVGINSRVAADSWSKTNLKVSKVIMHPGYNPNSLQNDIALMKLSSPVTLDTATYKIIPVCIPTTSNPFQGFTAYATGWGALYEGGVASNVLMEVPLPILSDNACTSYYVPYGLTVNPLTQVCAGIAGNGKDTCQGDSGGPLVSKGNDGRWYLVGLTSFGIGCGNTGVYTRVSGYQNWISTTLSTN